MKKSGWQNKALGKAYGEQAAARAAYSSTRIQKLERKAASFILIRGEGTPEGVVAAPVGSMYQRSDGGAGTSFYIKESGSGITGWIGK